MDMSWPFPAYRRMAQKAGKIWREYGALDYREWVAEDVEVGKLTSFPRSVKLKPGEISKVVDLGGNHYIMKVEERQGGRSDPARNNPGHRDRDGRSSQPSTGSCPDRRARDARN